MNLMTALLVSEIILLRRHKGDRCEVILMNSNCENVMHCYVYFKDDDSFVLFCFQNHSASV